MSLGLVRSRDHLLELLTRSTSISEIVEGDISMHLCKHRRASPAACECYEPSRRRFSVQRKRSILGPIRSIPFSHAARCLIREGDVRADPLPYRFERDEVQISRRSPATAIAQRNFRPALRTVPEAAVVALSLGSAVRADHCPSSLTSTLITLPQGTEI